MHTLLKVAAVAVLLAAGQIQLKLAVAAAPDGVSPLGLLVAMLRDLRFWSACTATFFGAVLWLWTLSSINLSIAYPILVGLSTLLVVLAAVGFLGESITAAKVVGILLVLGGLYLVHR